ncbi:hypothetical protein OAO01_06335, partial [Oligoflexia bacterium]|nr:hypothetical protein [Oligoflexia bacterium]
ARLAYHGFAYNRGMPTAVSKYGKNGGLLGTTSFDYYQGGAFAGLLKSVTTLLGGVTTYHYKLNNVPLNSTPGIALERVVAAAVTIDPSAVDQDPVNIRFDYQGGSVGVRGFSGFAEIRVINNRGGYTKYEYTTASTSVPLLTSVSVWDSAGKLLQRNQRVFEWGGVNSDKYALKQVINELHGASANSKTTRGFEREWNFDRDRAEGITYYGQTEYDSQRGRFRSMYPEDDMRVELEYRADLPALGKFNLLRSWSAFDAATTKLAETIYLYDANGFVREEQEFDNTHGSYLTTQYRHSSLGDLERASAGGHTVSYNWTDGFLKSQVVAPGTLDLTVQYDYEPESRLLQKVTQPSGVHLSIERDEFFRLERQLVLNSDETHSSAFFAASYDIPNRRASFTASGITNWYALDGFGGAIKASEDTSVAGQFPSQAAHFDAGGLLARITTPNYLSDGRTLNSGEVFSQHGVTYNYDDNNRLLGFSPDTAGDGLGPWSVLHEASGAFGSPSPNPQGSVVEGPLGKKSESGVFSNRAYAKIGEGSEELSFNLTLHPFESRLADMQANSFVTNYNSLGLVTSHDLPKNAPASIEYDQNGVLYRVRFASGKETEYGFDPVGRLRSIAYRDATTSQSDQYLYFWDAPLVSGLTVAQGQLSGIVGPYDAIEFGYDDFGRVQNIVHHHLDGQLITRSFGVEYDALTGQVARILYPPEAIGGTVAVDYLYDDQGRERLISSPSLLTRVAGGVVRSVEERNADGVIKHVQIPIYHLEELISFSATSSLVENRKLLQSGSLLDEIQYTYDERNLTQRERVTGSNSTTDTFDTYDTRNFLQHYTRQRGTGTPTSYSIGRDGLGRQTAEPERDITYYYQTGSTHPYAPDGVQAGGTNYDWDYNVDRQITQARGPERGDNLALEYGPDTEVARVTNQAGDTLTLARGVLGDVVKLEVRDVTGNLKLRRRKFLLGMYLEHSEPLQGTTATIKLYGEGTTGGHGPVAKLLYDINASFGDGGGELGDPGGNQPHDPPTGRKKPVPPVVPLPLKCGNGRIDPGEQCDGNTNTCLHPLNSTCVKCQCVEPAGPPPRKVIITIAPGDVDDQGIWYTEGTAPRSQSELEMELFSSVGFDLELTSPCDRMILIQFKLHQMRSSLGSRWWDFVRGLNYESVRQLAKYGLRSSSCRAKEQGYPCHKADCFACSFQGLAGMHRSIAWDEQGAAYAAAQSEGWGLCDWLQTGLDAAGCFDPTPICDGINGLIYAARGMWADAGISSASMIPFIGDFSKTGRACTRGSSLVGEVVIKEIYHADDVVDLVRQTRRNRLDVVLGSSSRELMDYRDYAKQIGGAVLDVPDDVWSSLNKADRLALNRSFMEYTNPSAAYHLYTPGNAGMQGLRETIAKAPNGYTLREVVWAGQHGRWVWGKGKRLYQLNRTNIDAATGFPKQLLREFPELKNMLDKGIVRFDPFNPFGTGPAPNVPVTIKIFP